MSDYCVILVHHLLVSCALDTDTIGVINYYGTYEDQLLLIIDGHFSNSCFLLSEADLTGFLEDISVELCGINIIKLQCGDRFLACLLSTLHPRHKPTAAAMPYVEHMVLV